MVRKQIIVAVAVVAMVLGIVWIAFTLTTQPHSIIFHYTDGTTSELTPFLSITYDDKSVETIEYKIQGENIELSSYTPYFYSPLGIYPLVSQNGSNASWIVDIWDILYYTLNDGTYTVMLVPGGEIQGMSLPNPIAFELKILDDRTINLVFSN